MPFPYYGGNPSEPTQSYAFPYLDICACQNTCFRSSVSCSKASSPSAYACLAPPGSSLSLGLIHTDLGSSCISVTTPFHCISVYLFSFVKRTISLNPKQGMNLSTSLIYFNVSFIYITTCKLLAGSNYTFLIHDK